jgi:ketosteroid isomerase-like protein
VELVTMLQPSGVDLVAATREDDVFAEVPRFLFTDDFETSFTAVGARASIGPYKGVDGLARAWRDWLEPWERYVIHAEEFLDAGDRVVVYVRIRGRTHRDGVDVEHAPAAVWTIRDGRVSSIAFYLEREEALAAAGLQE